MQEMSMKIIHYILIAVFSMLALFGGCANTGQDNDVLFQVSTIDALMAGIYDGQMLYGELTDHGDMGIGTFTDLDGEMIGVKGDFYQIKVDGMAYPVDDSMGTPFALVTFFEPDIKADLPEPMDFERLQSYIDSLIATDNIFYAIIVEGRFHFLKVRSVPPQSKPYPVLTEAIEHQAVFEYSDRDGILAGFRTPAYMSGLNVPGYHFHFISEDRKYGGHVLDCIAQDCGVKMDATNSLLVQLPENEAFYRMDFSGDNTEAIDKVEK
jgi:acetolactate decarboxylase